MLEDEIDINKKVPVLGRWSLETRSGTPVPAGKKSWIFRVRKGWQTQTETLGPDRGHLSSGESGNEGSIEQGR